MIFETTLKAALEHSDNVTVSDLKVTNITWDEDIVSLRIEHENGDESVVVFDATQRIEVQTWGIAICKDSEGEEYSLSFKVERPLIELDITD